MQHPGQHRCKYVNISHGFVCTWTKLRYIYQQARRFDANRQDSSQGQGHFHSLCRPLGCCDDETILLPIRFFLAFPTLLPLPTHHASHHMCKRTRPPSGMAKPFMFPLTFNFQKQLKCSPIGYLIKSLFWFEVASVGFEPKTSRSRFLSLFHSVTAPHWSSVSQHWRSRLWKFQKLHEVLITFQWWQNNHRGNPCFVCKKNGNVGPQRKNQR